MIENRAYFTTKEVAVKCGVTVQTIRDWRVNKGLRAHQIGAKKFVYNEADLERFLKGE
jgi:excisionase family DNA binding protein